MTTILIIIIILLLCRSYHLENVIQRLCEEIAEYEVKENKKTDWEYGEYFD